MKSQLLSSFSFLFLVCKYLGLTSYTITNTKIFKRSKRDRVINVILLILIFFGTIKIKTCHNKYDKYGNVSSHISRIILYVYFVVLIGTLNVKQTKIVKLFSKILDLEKFVLNITNKNIDVTTLTKNLKYFIIAHCINTLILIILNLPLIYIIGVPLCICVLKFALTCFVQVTAEALLFHFLNSTVIIIRHLNNNFETVSLNNVIKCYNILFALKKKIEEIIGFYAFVKITHIVIEIATTLYSLRRDIHVLYYSDETVLNMVLVLNAYWLIHTAFQTFLLIYPITNFWNEVT